MAGLGEALCYTFVVSLSSNPKSSEDGAPEGGVGLRIWNSQENTKRAAGQKGT